MANSPYTVTIVDRPAETLAGLKVATDMERASIDCPKLWEKDFGPRMCEFKLEGEPRSYGVSCVTDLKTGAFDYWAAMPIADPADIPPGMATVDLPAGPYAECAIPSLEALSEAYTYIYSRWLPQQPGYEAANEHPSYELYMDDFMETGRLILYFPVRKV